MKEIDSPVYLPAPRGDGYVELARVKDGRLFRKQILKYGNFAHPNEPGEKLVIDKKYGQKLVTNFKNGICDIVQVPIVNDGNKHVENPERNIGEVIDVQAEDDGVYVTVDARKSADDLGKTLIGASAFMHPNYTDTNTGEKVGPTLLHVAVTNRPYITNLKGFEEIIAASADTYGDEEPVVLTSEDEGDSTMPMTRDEMIAALKAEHGVDVAALEAKAAVGLSSEKSDELLVALSNVLTAAGVTKPDESETLDIKDVAEAVVELAGEKVALANTVATLQKDAESYKLERATKEVEAYIKAGRILPKQKDTMIQLSMDDRTKFDALLPEDAIVALSEDGVTTHDAPDSERVTKESDRLLALANDIQGRKKR